MKKTVLFILLFLMQFASAQDTPAPFKINSMVDFTEIPTASATGVPDVKIPLHQIKTQGDMNIDLSLQYNLIGGLSTESMGSQFGDAWNLTMLGTISRKVSRINAVPGMNYLVPDESYFYANHSNMSNEIGYDVYTFNILGLEGKFKLSKVNNVLVAELLQNNDFVSITVDYNQSIRKIQLITVKDKNGYTYYFEDEGVRDENKYFRSTPNPFPENSIHNPNYNPNTPVDDYTVEELNGPAYTSMWYLKKVQDHNNKTLFEIEYENVSMGFSTVAYIKNISVNNIGKISFTNIVGTNFKNLTNSYTKSIEIKDVRNNLVKTIEFDYQKISLSMDNGRNHFIKLYLNKIKSFNNDKSKSENYELSYYQPHLNATKVTIKDGFLTLKDCYSDFTTFSNIAKYMTLQKVKYPTGGYTLYQFEPNTFQSSSYSQWNIFNKEYLTITPTFNPNTLKYTFQVPQGYEKLYIKLSYNSGSYSLFHNGQHLSSLWANHGLKLENFCKHDYRLNELYLQGRWGVFEITGPTHTFSVPTITVLAIKPKPAHAMEKFEYGHGVRIKRIGHFITNVANTYLEANNTANLAEQLLSFDYHNENDILSTTGRLQYENDPLSDSFYKKKLLYEQVTTTKRNIGKVVTNFNNVHWLQSFWYRKNMLPKWNKVYDTQSNLIEETHYSRVYTTVGKQDILTQQTVDKKHYEQDNFTTATTVQNFDVNHRQLISQSSTNNLGKNTKVEHSYQQLSNKRMVKRVDKNYINNQLKEEVQHSYNAKGDLLRSDFKTPEVPALEPIGTINRYDAQGNLVQTITPDGVSTCYIWGYNKTKIVAKLVNLSYTDFTSNLSIVSAINQINNRSNQLLANGNLNTNYNETQLKNILANLHTIVPNAMVTCYIYKPLIGISEIIDENGKSTYYEYDKFQRLKTIKNHQREILKEYDYNLTN
ncbi:hypothetical protein AB4865_06270 [Capnocytophaga sp. ARDL2]|uniref:hypothetical protein n=1 Tax=Capnocytophaga sp. ARDL2 TaxID=3238809 RepID=UPI00355780D8